MELATGQTITFSPDIKPHVSDVYEYYLYHIATLQDVLDDIDEIPEYYPTIDIEQILSEIGCEISFEELLESDLHSKSRAFLREYFTAINKKDFADYNDGVIDGEITFWDVVDFRGEDNEVFEQILQDHYNITESNELKGCLESATWNSREDVIYIICFNTRVIE